MHRAAIVAQDMRRSMEVCVKSILNVVLLTLCVSACASLESRNAQYSPIYETFERYVAHSKYIETSVGVLLAADIYQPARASEVDQTPQPVVIFPTVYNRAHVTASAMRFPAKTGLISEAYAGGLEVTAAELLRHGYVIVVVDAYGTGASFGRNAGFLDSFKRQGIIDTINWASDQPWSTGEIGVSGLSWNAGLALLPALDPAPNALKAVFARSPDVTIGALKYGQIPKWEAGFLWQVLAEPDEEEVGAQSEDLTVAPVGAGNQLLAAQAQQFGEDARAYAKELRTAAMNRMISCENPQDSGLDRASSLIEYSPLKDQITALEKGAVPLYVMSGAHDWLSIAQSPMYLSSARNARKLAWHPGPHHEAEMAANDPRAKAATMFLRREVVRWFDYWLRGLDTGILDEPRVTAPMLDIQWGEDQVLAMDVEYVYAPRFPLPNAREHQLALQSVGTTVPGAKVMGRLAKEAAKDQTTVALPVDLSPDVSGGSTYGVRTAASFEGQTLYDNMSAHDDLGLTFTSDPLVTDMAMQGPVTLTLDASLEGKRAMIYAFLEEVTPSGQSRYVSEGAVTLSQNVIGINEEESGCSPQSPSSSGDKRVDIDFAPVFNRFNKGNAIRISILPFDAGYIWNSPYPEIKIDKDAVVDICIGGDCTSELRFFTIND